MSSTFLSKIILLWNLEKFTTDSQIFFSSEGKILFFETFSTMNSLHSWCLCHLCFQKILKIISDLIWLWKCVTVIHLLQTLLKIDVEKDSDRLKWNK